MTERPHQLRAVSVGDNSSAWADAGFTVRDDAVQIDRTSVSLLGSMRQRGVVSVCIDQLTDADQIDGLALGVTPTFDTDVSAPAHPNRVCGLDHLVVTTPDCDRTTLALEAAGLEARRIRTFEAAGAIRRQTFFWLGTVILELVGPDAAEGDEPAAFWGVALTTDDIDATADHLGDLCSPPRDAVQPGRRIATLRTRDLDISIAVAFMSPHPSRT